MPSRSRRAAAATLAAVLTAGAATALAVLPPGAPAAVSSPAPGPGPAPDEPARLLQATAPAGLLPVRYLEGASQGPPVSAAAALLLEASTATVLYAKNEHQRRAPASTTKIVTALLAVESDSLARDVTVSRQAARIPGSSAGLRPGQRYTLEELLYAMMLPSGNDAATAVAEHLDGSAAAFAARMNRRARELGAYSSHFVNPHGLDDSNHYSTAYDLALFARTALQYPLFARVVGTRSYAAPSGQGAWHSTNRLLWSFEGALGVKTGTTGRAGHCLVAAAARDGTTLVAVVLDSADRWADSVRLLEYGFSAFARVVLASPEDEVASVAVPGGRPGKLRVVAAQRLAMMVPARAVQEIRGAVHLARLTPPLRAGSVVGELVAYRRDQAVGRIPLIAAHGVSLRPWWLPW